MLHEINMKNLEENLKGKSIVMVHADWCGPCQMTKPIIEGISDEFKDINILMVNADQNKENLQSRGISSLPTLLFFDEDKKIGEHIGFASKDVILDKININEKNN